MGRWPINVVGSGLMGLVAGWFAFRAGEGAPQGLRLFLTTGILGGFTTFSAFSLDAVLLWERGETALAALYVGGSVVAVARRARRRLRHRAGAVMRTGGKGSDGRAKGSGPKRGGRPPAAGAPKGKRPSHDARRSARAASARPRPEREEGALRTEPTRNPAPHHPAPRAAGPRKPAPRKAPVTDQPTRAEVKAETAQVLATGVQQLVVTPDENEMRIDRFLEARFPQLSFSHIQRIVRKGELRVNGKRADSKDRLEAGQTVRIPPLKLEPAGAAAALAQGRYRHDRFPALDHALRG